VAIDRCDWHSGGDFPDKLPDTAAGTHIGFFLYWLITRQLVGEEHKLDEDSLADIVKVNACEMTGRDFLFKNCDGKFWDSDVEDSIIPFVHSYYGENIYYRDLESALCQERQYETIYHADDSNENAIAIAKIIDTRFEAWKNTQ
jgi:hypothetical protein